MFKSKFKKPPSPPPAPDMQAPVTAAGIEAVFSDCYDFETRELHIGGDENRKAVLCFIDGLVSGSDVAEQVIRPLTSPMRFNGGTDMPGVISMLLGGSVYVYTAKKCTTVSDTVEDMLGGFCAIVFDKEHTAVTFEVKSQERR